MSEQLWNEEDFRKYILAKPIGDPTEYPTVIQHSTHSGMKEFLVMDVEEPFDRDRDDRWTLRVLNQHFRPVTFFMSHDWLFEIKGDGVFRIHEYS